MAALIALLRFSPVSAYISTEMNMFKDCMGQRGLQGPAVNVVNDMRSMLSALCCPCFRCISTVHAVHVVNAMIAMLSTLCCQCCQCISTVHAVHVVNAVFHAVDSKLYWDSWEFLQACCMLGPFGPWLTTLAWARRNAARAQHLAWARRNAARAQHSTRSPATTPAATSPSATARTAGTACRTATPPMEKIRVCVQKPYTCI